MPWADQIRHCRQLAFCGLLCLLFSAPAISQTTAETSNKSSSKSKHHSRAASKTSSHTTKNSHGKKTKKTSKKHGQQAIDSTRARQIQTALIREHYMQGDPSGTWDAATQAAMQKYQADHGWQGKTTPDSRALIKLGLGPSHDHLLNPESAMTSAPAEVDPKAAPKQTPAENNIPQP
jgi:hypothetical protein